VAGRGEKSAGNMKVVAVVGEGGNREAGYGGIQSGAGGRVAAGGKAGRQAYGRWQAG